MKERLVTLVLALGAFALFYAFFITLGNLMVDIAYGFADPRIRESR